MLRPILGRRGKTLPDAFGFPAGHWLAVTEAGDLELECGELGLAASAFRTILEADRVPDPQEVGEGIAREQHLTFWTKQCDLT